MEEPDHAKNQREMKDGKDENLVFNRCFENEFLHSARYTHKMIHKTSAVVSGF